MWKLAVLLLLTIGCQRDREDGAPEQRPGVAPARSPSIYSTTVDPLDGPPLGNEILDLLRLRRSLQTRRLDDAIRYLTSIYCSLQHINDPSDFRSVERVPIEQLYDVSVLNESMTVGGCTSLILKDGSQRCGEFGVRLQLCVPHR